MTRKLLTFIALSGFAAASVAADSNFLADELRGLHSDLTSAHQWVDSDIRANLSHRWKTAPGRLTDVGLNFAEAKLLGLSWVTDADLRQETDSDGKWMGFGASGTGLLWTGESFAFGMQPSAEWTAADGVDFASFGVFGRRALGDWGVIGANVFGDYSEDAENGAFSRWSLGADFQSALAEVRGNWYSGSAGFRERWSEAGRVFAYAPSGVDAELRLRWSGDSEWTGFAEYEKWDGRFGNADIQEVGYGLTYRPLGGGLLSGLRVDAGYRDSADSVDGWDLRVGYSRVLGGDNSSRRLDFGFGVRSALVDSVERTDVRVESVTVRHRQVQARANVSRLNSQDGLWVYDYPPYFDWDGECDLTSYHAPAVSQSALAVSILAFAGDDSRFDSLCETMRSGANINTQNGSGETALHLAVGGNAVNNAKLLLASSMVDSGITDNAGNTALDVAQMKYRERGTPQARATARTVAMVLRAEGVSCRRLSGAVCRIDYTPALEDDSIFPRLWVFAALTVTSDVQGEIYQIRVPGWEDAVVSIDSHDHPDLLTVLADNRVSVIEGANLFRAGGFNIYANIYYPNGLLLGWYYLFATVEDARISPVWTTPEVRRTVPNYTGALFSLTVAPPTQKYFSAFTGGFDGFVSYPYSIGYPDFDYAVSLTREIFPRPSYGQSRVGFSFRSRDGGLLGHHRQSVIMVSAQRPITISQPMVGELQISAYAPNYVWTGATFAFTIAAVDIPQRMDFTLSAGQPQTLATINADGLREVDYEVIGVPAKLTLDGDKLRLVSALGIGESAEMTVELTSPDLLGTLTITASARVVCDSESGVVLNEFDYNNQINIDLAIASRDVNIAKMCAALRQGANPNTYEYGKQRMLAAMYEPIRDIEVKRAAARLLLDSGADPNATRFRVDYYDKGERLIHLYAQGGERQFSVLEEIVRDGANPLVYTNVRQTPMHRAADNSDDVHRAFDLILDTAIARAASPSELISYLNTTVTSNARTALHEATDTIADNNPSYRIRRLLEAGASVNVRDNQLWTPLMYAIDRQNEKSVCALLKKMHNLSLRNRAGNTALELANAGSSENIQNWVRANYCPEQES